MLLYASKYRDIHILVNVSGRYDLNRGIAERLGEDFMQIIKKDGYIDVKNKTGNVLYCFHDMYMFLTSVLFMSVRVYLLFVRLRKSIALPIGLSIQLNVTLKNPDRECGHIISDEDSCLKCSTSIRYLREKKHRNCVRNANNSLMFPGNKNIACKMWKA